MKLTGSSALLTGAALLSAMSAVSAEGIVQAHVKPLIVKKGGIVTVTVNFVVDDLTVPNRDLLTLQADDLIAGLSTDPSYGFGFFWGIRSIKNDNDTKNHTGKHADKYADDDKITIRSAKIFPNTWKPKESADIDVEEAGDTAIFTLPEEGVVQDKEYKITYKVRVGRGVDSGVIDLPVAFAGPGLVLDNDLQVLVR